MGRLQPFLNIRTEGALLPSDLLSRLVEGINLPGLKPEDYHLGAGEKLNEAISRSWTRLLSLWLGFRKAQAALPPTDLGTTLTRERWLLQLFQELGYGRLIIASPIEIDGKTYPISHIWQGQYYQVPIHLISFRADLDKRSEQRIQGASRSSPHGMVQEFLNRSEHHLWALVSNGLKFLILRDSASLTRQAYVEFDLESIFDGESYADFRLLWMLCHQSRLEGTAQDRPETCWLEVWSKQAETEGRRALDQLRIGVQKALESLGTGFIAHKANQNLRDRLQSGELHKQDFYRQLLRLIYRLIFLFVAEDRDLLHFPGASDEARSRYARFYSGQRLRRMAERTRGSLHADLWVGLRLVFAKLGEDGGSPELGLPVLGGFLFGPRTMPDLEAAALSNEHLLQAIRNLGLVKDHSGWRLVDYRNLGSEELGSVYESLLELNPTMELDAGIFNLGTVAGNQRKTSGSYYTPDSLVQCLLDSALDPVVEQATKGKTPAEAEKAILALKVCDPAVGSGHFLVGAAHRLAKHLAQVRAQLLGESEPSPLYYQRALRDVIGHCLYGVDVNPMAAELCRVSLWLEAIEPGKPLSFLDHHIRVGNSLLGATPAQLAKGIPDDAFTPIEGDDKEVCKRFKKLNNEERIGFRRLFVETNEPWERLGNLAASMMRLDDAPDDSIDAIHEKERMYEAMVRSGNYLDGQLWADAWCAAFVWKKTREFQYPITEEVFRRIEQNPHACDAWMRNEIDRLSRQYQFFHWHLAFPDVFHIPSVEQTEDNEQQGWSGGFDVVLGNPPWDTLSPDAKEFFSKFDPEVRSLSPADQEARIAELLRSPTVAADWTTSCRNLYALVLFIKESGRYKLFAPGNLGKGDFNVYRMFVETALRLTKPKGWAAQVVPEGFYNGANCMAIREFLFQQTALSRILGFENAKGAWFEGVHKSAKFCIYSAENGNSTQEFLAAFNIRTQERLDEVSAGHALSIPVPLIAEFSPDALAIMEFSSQFEIDVAKKMYSRYPKFGDEWAGPPTRTYMTEVHMGNDRDLFSEDRAGMPVYEGRMVSTFDHRAKGYSSGRGRSAKWTDFEFSDPRKEIRPQWSIEQARIPSKLGDRIRHYRIGFCDVASPTNERSLVAALIPPNCICGHKVPTITFEEEFAWFYMLWLAVANSFTTDFIVRKKISLSMSYTILDSLPFPRLGLGITQVKRLVELGLRLTCTGPEMNAYWNSIARLGVVEPIDEHSGAPGYTQEAQRHYAIAEIEAITALQLYGLTREELAYVLDTFPIVKRRDEERWGEYRTKRVILEIYDAMAEAVYTGIPDQTRLAPPPADPSVAHPWREEIAQVAPANKDAISNLVEVPDEAWATPVGVTPEHVALFSLIDVLRTIGEPVDLERIRLAAILVRKPALATAFMEETQADEWIRVVGRDAQPLTGNVIQISHFQMNATDHPWAEAINQLRGSGAFVTDSSGKWLASDRLPMSSGQDWISGRAAVAVQVLAAIVQADAEQKVIAFIRSVEDGTATRAVS